MRITTIEQLREARTKAGLTQVEMATAMGLGNSTYAEMETGVSKNFRKPYQLAAERALQLHNSATDPRLVYPKHMSASDMIERCDERDIVELVDRLVGNFLDRDKLLKRVQDSKYEQGRIREKADQIMGIKRAPDYDPESTSLSRGERL